MPASSVVFDSWALLALLQGEAAAGPVRDLIWKAARARRPRSVASVNLGEVWYNIARDAGWALARRAAQLKCRHKLAYADSFAAALAIEQGAELVTGDPDFRSLEGSVNIH